MNIQPICICSYFVLSLSILVLIDNNCHYDVQYSGVSRNLVENYSAVYSYSRDRLLLIGEMVTHNRGLYHLGHCVG